MAVKSFHQKQRYRFSLSRTALYIIGIIIVLGIAYSAYGALNTGIASVSGLTTFTLPINGSASFTLSGDPNTYSVFVKGATNGSATLYFSGVPILVKPIVIVTASVPSSANISTSAGSVANVHLDLLSYSGSALKFDLTALASNLGIGVTNRYVSIITPSITGAVGGSLTTTTVSTTIPTTTVAANSVTTTAVTTATTTVASSVPTGQVMAAANATQVGLLMKDFKALYIKGQSCTSSLYNSAYSTYVGGTPAGPNTYQNVSQTTPTDTNWTITSLGGTLYNVTYTLIAPTAAAAGKAVVLEINTANGAEIATSFAGPFFDLNYTVLAHNYNFQSGTGSVCGALLP